MTGLDIEAIRRRSDAVVDRDPPIPLVDALTSALDVPTLLEEIERLRVELAEEKQSHEQTVENFADWIEDHQETPPDSFHIEPPTHDTGWTWKCLRCDKAHGSALRERDVIAAAVAHEHAAHGGA